MGGCAAIRRGLCVLWKVSTFTVTLTSRQRLDGEGPASDVKQEQ